MSFLAIACLTPSSPDSAEVWDDPVR
jgi:hypothetical protein